MTRCSGRLALVATVLLASILLGSAHSPAAEGSTPKRRALVLGGGGPVGEAWEYGIIAGLAEKGVDLSHTDLIVGTSAGSIVGAHLAMETPADLMKHISEALDGSATAQPSSTASPPAPPPDLSILISKFQEIDSGKRPPEQVRPEIGEWALKTRPIITEDQVVASLMRRFPEQRWPDRSYECTTVDTADGSLKVWSKDSGVPLARAVASSCAFPGVFAPITINGHRYMDGGMWSATHADLAKNYQTVIVVAPTVGYTDEIGKRFKAPLDSELKTLRDGGSDVELIAPDAASIEAFGSSLGDASRRASAGAAGRAEGRSQAAKIRSTWSS